MVDRAQWLLPVPLLAHVAVLVRLKLVADQERDCLKPVSEPAEVLNKSLDYHGNCRPYGSVQLALSHFLK